MVPNMMIIQRTRSVYLLVISLIMLISVSCGDSKPNSRNTGFQMASMAGMPAEVQAAPVTVQQAYQINVANPDIMTHIPCYCGCGAMGHKSNYDCYVDGKNEDGTIKYDTHALGCSICVDITQDAMRLLQEGKSVEQIKAYVDQTYAQYGPSNMP